MTQQVYLHWFSCSVHGVARYVKSTNPGFKHLLERHNAPGHEDRPPAHFVRFPLNANFLHPKSGLMFVSSRQPTAIASSLVSAVCMLLSAVARVPLPKLGGTSTHPASCLLTHVYACEEPLQLPRLSACPTVRRSVRIKLKPTSWLVMQSDNGKLLSYFIFKFRSDILTTALHEDLPAFMCAWELASLLCTCAF